MPPGGPKTHPTSAASAGKRGISFLTFNYDRLIEYYFQTVVRNAFNVRPEVAKEIVGSMRIVHLHGQVAGQEFGQYQTPMPSVLLQAAARGIRVIHDPVARDDANFQTAHALLEQAQRICLLGFGYHPVNIERLQLRSYLANASVALDGSTFRMGEAQIRVAQGQLGRAFRYVSTYQAETFLREMVPLV